MPLDALEQAIDDRCADTPGLLHHSDSGTQYLSMRYTDRLADGHIARSVGSRGDSYDCEPNWCLVSPRPKWFDARPMATSRGRRIHHAGNGSTGSTRGACSSRSATVRPAEYEPRYYEQAAVT